MFLASHLGCRTHRTLCIAWMSAHGRSHKVETRHHLTEWHPTNLGRHTPARPRCGSAGRCTRRRRPGMRTVNHVTDAIFGIALASKSWDPLQERGWRSRYSAPTFHNTHHCRILVRDPWYGQVWCGYARTYVCVCVYMCAAHLNVDDHEPVVGVFPRKVAERLQEGETNANGASSSAFQNPPAEAFH